MWHDGMILMKENSSLLKRKYVRKDSSSMVNASSCGLYLEQVFSGAQFLLCIVAITTGADRPSSRLSHHINGTNFSSAKMYESWG